MAEPILIGIGSTEAQMAAVQVLSYTLHKHTDRELEIVPLFKSGIEIPEPKDPKNRARTPFSFQRFTLPELGGHKRRTIYFDSDMIVFSDVGKLYDTGMRGLDAMSPGNTPGRGYESRAVLLMSETCPWSVADLVQRLDDGELTYEELMFEFKVPGKTSLDLPYTWNSLELYEPGKTDLLHYTDMWLQPWLVRDNPRAHIWMRELFGAIDAGYLGRDDIARAVERRWVRPSLLYQVEKRIEDPRRVPFWVKLKDRSFINYAKEMKFRIF
jgi:hypothetical protein